MEENPSSLVFDSQFDAYAEHYSVFPPAAISSPKQRGNTRWAQHASSSSSATLASQANTISNPSSSPKLRPPSSRPASSRRTNARLPPPLPLFETHVFASSAATKQNAMHRPRCDHSILARPPAHIPLSTEMTLEPLGSTAHVLEAVQQRVEACKPANITEQPSITSVLNAVVYDRDAANGRQSQLDSQRRAQKNMYKTSAMKRSPANARGSDEIVDYDDLIPFYHPKTKDDQTLVFESRFESGNLHRAIQLQEREYDLLVTPDSNTSTPHTQWFYFSVRNTRKSVLPRSPSPSLSPNSYVRALAEPPLLADATRFNLVNFQKSSSLYNKGMRPLVYSAQKAKRTGIGWHRAGNDVVYFCNYTRRNRNKRKKNRYLYSLSFNYSFEYSNDTVWFAYCYPYTYTNLHRDLVLLESDARNSRFMKRRWLCTTLAGNKCDLLTITDFSSSAEEIRARRGIVITARVHPGESNASYVMKGTIEFLLSGSEAALFLLRKFVFKIVPMLNPDGVIQGNYRCSLAGVDLNRVWNNPSVDQHPTIYHAKQMILSFCEARPVLMCLDLHGHSRKFNTFVYGCSSAGIEDTDTHPPSSPGRGMGNGDEEEGDSCAFMRSHKQQLKLERVFPMIMERRSLLAGMPRRPTSNTADPRYAPPSSFSDPDSDSGHLSSSLFSYDDCSFSVLRQKASTFRVVLHTETNLINSFTLETSFAGADKGSRAGYHYNINHYEHIGVLVCQSIVDYASSSVFKRVSAVLSDYEAALEATMEPVDQLLRDQHRARMGILRRSGRSEDVDIDGSDGSDVSSDDDSGGAQGGGKSMYAIVTRATRATKNRRQGNNPLVSAARERKAEAYRRKSVSGASGGGAGGPQSTRRRPRSAVMSHVVSRQGYQGSRRAQRTDVLNGLKFTDKNGVETTYDKLSQSWSKYARARVDTGLPRRSKHKSKRAASGSSGSSNFFRLPRNSKAREYRRSARRTANTNSAAYTAKRRGGGGKSSSSSTSASASPSPISSVSSVHLRTQSASPAYKEARERNMKIGRRNRRGQGQGSSTHAATTKRSSSSSKHTTGSSSSSSSVASSHIEAAPMPQEPSVLKLIMNLLDASKSGGQDSDKQQLLSQPSASPTAGLRYPRTHSATYMTRTHAKQGRRASLELPRDLPNAAGDDNTEADMNMLSLHALFRRKKRLQKSTFASLALRHGKVY